MTVLFYIFATILVYSALSVVLRRNPVVAVMHLILAFVASAALWLLLSSEFLAIVLVLVYVGAVMVLFLFVIMLLEPNLAQLRQTFTGLAPLGILLASGLIVSLWYALSGESDFAGAQRMSVEPVAEYDNTYVLGKAIFARYLYPFELAAMILLLAIVAAIYLNLRIRGKTRKQIPSSQIQVKKEDRLKMVKVETARSPDIEPDPTPVEPVDGSN